MRCLLPPSPLPLPFPHCQPEKISPGDKKEGITQYAPPLLPSPKSDSRVSLPCVHSMGINGHEIQRAVKGREICGRSSRVFWGGFLQHFFAGHERGRSVFRRFRLLNAGK